MATTQISLDLHAKFLSRYGRDDADKLEMAMGQYLKMSAIYWCVTALDLMGELDGTSDSETGLDGDMIIAFVMECYDEQEGAFAPAPGHDTHLLYTLSAIQILAMYEKLDLVNASKIAQSVAKLQQPDGSFIGDHWGEIDTRFSFCALATLALLKTPNVIDRMKAKEFVLNCINFDGGFGTAPGSESHAGQIYCCLGSLWLLDALEHAQTDRLSWWLSERQLDAGGLNGRPQKLPDVCYSWWVLASLAMLKRIHYINKEKLIDFIANAQDTETGGIADRPGDITDPFHTLFGLTGLSLLKAVPTLKDIHPVLCMPNDRLKNTHPELAWE
eukprot:Clim_evm91s210 gene=Clim_evmTU91s210